MGHADLLFSPFSLINLCFNLLPTSVTVFLSVQNDQTLEKQNIVKKIFMILYFCHIVHF